MTHASDLVSKMTLGEKISLLAGVDLWRTQPVPRLGIPSIKVTDGPNGARGAWGDLSPSSALFPVGTALAATWNEALIERTGMELAKETKAKGSQVLLGPTVNIHRTPLAGRNFEYFSEDPYLSGKIAAAYIRGLQREGIAACIKHFVCNDQEFERFTISAEVDERALREIYLEPFRRALVEAQPWTIMSSYNRLNGTYASENAALLKALLKEEWQYDGYVISDWKGTYSENVPAGGLDLEMPGPARWMAEEHVRKALESGALTEAELDDKVERLLRLIERTGASVQSEAQEERSEDTPEQRAFLRNLGHETIVLLKNEKGLLPLEPGKVRKIAVIGELAERANVMGGGSSRVSPHYVVSPLEGIRARSGETIEVKYALGCVMHRRIPAFRAESLRDEDGRAGGLSLRLYDNLDFSGNPGFELTTDRASFDWWGPGVPGVDQERFSARLSGTFTAKEAGTHMFALQSIGEARLLLDGAVVIDNWEQYESYVEKIETRELAEGQSLRLVVEFRWDSNEYGRFLRFGHWPPAPEDPIKEAVQLAAEADAAIVLAGLTSDWESEGYDRVSMSLPGQQDELIERVAAVNPNTIVVLNTGSPVLMPWEGQVPAILQQWYNGQECGNALADILFGDADPSGRLPTTFPRRYEDNPTTESYPGEGGRTTYREGLFVGYRHYDLKRIEPLFPFGHGSSYTSFVYEDIQLSGTRVTMAEGVDVSVELRNAGTRPGQEVVQLYVHDAVASVRRPEQELKAFAKVELAPGETRTVRFHLDRDAFWHYNPAKGGWIVEPGEFEIRAGHSSRELPLRARLTVTADGRPLPGPDDLQPARGLRTP